MRIRIGGINGVEIKVDNWRELTVKGRLSILLAAVQIEETIKPAPLAQKRDQAENKIIYIASKFIKKESFEQSPEGGDS